VPVVAIDGHLPLLAPGRMAPAALRERFAAAPAWAPEFTGDGRWLEREPRPAAVLVPLVQREGGLTVLLTQRTDHLHDHAGQVSFPGGRTDPGDRDARHTALREAQEEIGLPPERVEVLGQLPVYRTGTGYDVTPVVALVEPPLSLVLDAFEVAEAFEVPLPFLMNPAHHQRHAFEALGETRHFLSIPWRDPAATHPGREYFIWGATAAMLRNLYRLLAA
jgi:8-oxo-dGTP pyrophosphatase MutT (NUDIX family)